MPAERPVDRILVLAGTAEARDLANALVALGRDVTSSFAGVTQEPLLPVGQIHRGGFGGSDGLRSFLHAEQISLVVDATHPFAAQMSAQAHAACLAGNIRLLRLERPQWQAQDGDQWISATDMADAVTRIPQESHVLVTTGRKGLAGLFARDDLTGLVRSIEKPAEALPPGWSLLLDRPPYKVESEQRLMEVEGISCLLTKNAGGNSTVAKLSAARALRLPVVMIARPFKPACQTCSTVAEALLGIIPKAG
jgi:precorrin-6A/cobalt-precorrin-6A reductase